ncbi:MAG: dynamin family protein [Hyphomicrobiaceae bacterium]|nr:dynamin family protein [Hyphomicrobiaceae bacterium]
MSIPIGIPSSHLAPPPQPLFTPRAIGSGLEGYRRELAICGRDLRSAMPARGVIFIDEALQLLARLTCRIAVVGQVKSGKSTFINALVQRPALLPTDVNPWTTAVTRLHFGRQDNPPNVAAEFTFFDADEWELLAKGNGYIRELTQRLVPGFEEELLRSHVEAMRRRSEERLGSKLGELLGRKHVFSEVSSDILQRYVCSGPLAASGQTGLYSDVVKSADLYFSDANEFGFPTTIVDTPGTNDPFLVRDELTRRALAAADIYIVVLTARQALSSADIALIRILRGLNKDRIAVFINRIDEIGDITTDVATIVRHVKAGLQREFPASTIPVVAGSANWANIAQFGTKEQVEAAFSSGAKDYIGQAGTVAEGVKLSRADALALCSGLPTLTQEIAKLAIHSHAGYVMRQISRSFLEFVDVGQSAAQHELQLISHMAGAARGAPGASSADSEQLAKLLRDILDDLQARGRQAIERHTATILEQLQNAITSFAEGEGQYLREAIAAGRRYQVWRCETTSLRRELEQRFIEAYRTAQREMDRLDSQLVPALQALLRRHFPHWLQSEELEHAPPTDLPSVHALSQVVSLDLGEPWWQRWWSVLRGDNERVAQIEHLIKSEFFPLADEMAYAARQHLEAAQDVAVRRATAVYIGLVEGMEEQRKANEARRGEPGALDAPEDPRAVELRKQLALLHLVAQRLRKLERA